MSWRKRISDFESKLDNLTRESNARQEQAKSDLISQYRKVDQAQQKAIHAQRTSLTSRLATAKLRQARIALDNADILQQLDVLMWDAFGLNAVYPDAPLLQYPVVYCETLEEFFLEMLQDEALSDTAKQTILEQQVTEAKAHAENNQGGIMGVHLPGRGCYINGWIYGFVSKQSARDALQDKRLFPRILETTCHEKLGHGFVSALTATGQEKTRLGLWRFDLAQRSQTQTVDSPRNTLLRQKHALVHYASTLMEEGWATWIEQLMVWFATGQPGEFTPKYTLEAVANVITALKEQVKEDVEVLTAVDALDHALRILLVDDDAASIAQIPRAVEIVRKVGPVFDQAFSAALGQPTAYILGYLLLRRLEAQLGWRNMPYAIILAANVTYDLETISVNDLDTLLESDPQLNVNQRLALLSRLSLPEGKDYKALGQLAREVLNFAIPEGW